MLGKSWWNKLYRIFGMEFHTIFQTTQGNRHSTAIWSQKWQTYDHPLDGIYQG